MESKIEDFCEHREREISDMNKDPSTHTNGGLLFNMALVTYLKTTCIIQGYYLCETLISVRFDSECQFLGARFDRLNGIVIAYGC